MYYGRSLTDPINTAEDKYWLIPAFLRVKGLVKQHIDSFNYFTEHDLKAILKANEKILSDVDPKFYVQFTDIYIGKPSRKDEEALTRESPHSSNITPQECRLRDLTYAAPVFVDFIYTRGHELVSRKRVPIGRLPVMLKSKICILSKHNGAEQMNVLKECPLDPGGYFIVNGVEKVILIQEQLSKNRVFVEVDAKNDIVQASVTR